MSDTIEFTASGDKVVLIHVGGKPRRSYVRSIFRAKIGATIDVSEAAKEDAHITHAWATGDTEEEAVRKLESSIATVVETALSIMQRDVEVRVVKLSDYTR